MNNLLEKTHVCQETPNPFSGVVVGIDIGRKRTCYAAYRPGQRSKVQEISRDRAGIEQISSFLSSLKEGGYDVWVALEPTGVYSANLRQWLLRQPYHVVQVNTHWVKESRNTIDNSPGKRDKKDPAIIADLVWRGHYQRPLELDGIYAELRVCSAWYDSLRRERSRMRSSCRSTLEGWFPEMLQILKDPFCKTGCAIIRRYKGPEQIGRSSLCQFARFIKKVSRGSIKPEKAESLWLAARESIGLRGGEEARHERLCSQLALLEDLERHRERALGQMRRQLSELPEASSILSIPGLGLLTVGILLGECGNPACFHSYAAFEKFIGLNLFERSSGEHQGKRHISKRGRPRARYCVCEAAVFQLSKNGLFYEYAQEHPCAPGEKGKLRVAVARKLLKVIYALAKNRTLFDRARFFRFTGVRADHDQDIHQGTRLTVSAA